jgi:putative drug exporter of the RND superfamily
LSALLYRLGHFCVRRRWPVLAVWIVLLVGLVVVTRVIGEPTSNNLTLPGTGSTQATDLLADKLPKEQNGTVPIVLVADSGTLDKGANKQAVDKTVNSLSSTDGVEKAVSPLSSKGGDQLSKDKTIGYISLTLTDGQGDLEEDEANEIIDAAQPAVDAGLDVSAGGYLGQEVSKPATESSEAIGLGMAVIILLFTFGTVVAMALPISTAIFTVAIGLSLIGLLGHVMEVSTTAATLGTMIGLGVGIDYSLFIVKRYRERLADGLEVDEAIARSVATSGSAVVFAGGTVVIALCSLVLANIPLVTALGLSAASVVLVAVLAATTFLPALLGVIGRRIDSGKVPFGGDKPDDDRPHGWARWAHGVADHAWPALGLAVAILVVLSLPIFDLKLGQEDVGVLPHDTTSRQSYDALRDGFGDGANGPLLIAVKLNPPAKNDQKSLDQLNQQQQQQQQQEQQQVDAQANQIYEQLIAEGVPPDQAQQQAQQEAEAQAPQPSQAQQQKTEQQKKFLQSPASDTRLVKLENKISKTQGIDSTSEAKVSSNGTGAVFTATPTTAPSSYTTQDTIRDLRDNVIPAATKGSGLTAYVGGTTAGYIDLADRISDKLVSVIAIVVGLAFILLMLAFRSILVPITAALMNLLSVCAAYGVLTAVFEKGWGASVIGLGHSIPVESFVPLLMFAILFGLSMDYQVFLLSRIHEHYTESHDNREAVVDGLASSARVITSAALIMVSVFASFILNGDPTVKQFGVGLAVAIAVDATVVRCLLVPATMIIVGHRNWWFPSWLEQVLPRVGLESEDALPSLAPSREELAPARAEQPVP